MAHEELKQKQGVMWGAGNFDEVADAISDVHHTVVGRLKPTAGERYLDIACGTGRVCELAATAGATAVAYGEAARDGDHIVDDREYLLVSGTRR